MPKSDNSGQYLLMAGAAASAAALAYYMRNECAPIDPLYDFDHQSVEIDSVQRIRVCSSMRGKALMENRLSDVLTLHDTLSKGLQKSNNGACLGVRESKGTGPYTWISYSEVLQRVDCIGSALLVNGIPAGNSTFIGIYSANRPEWIISEHACYAYSMPVVSLYDSYGRDAIRYIIYHADLKTIFLDNFKRLVNILEAIGEQNNEYADRHQLELVVHFDALTPEQLERVTELNVDLNGNPRVNIISYSDLMKLGQNNLQPHVPPKPNDLATICYTSGTTGKPKGAMISHLNIIANEAAIYERLHRPHIGPICDCFSPAPVHMSYLPLAHMLERQASIRVFLAGGCMGFMSGDITTLVGDIKELKPTDIPMVPRMLNRIYAQVMGQVSGNPFKRMLLNRAVEIKNADRQKGVYHKDTIYDRLIFNKLRESFGGRIIRVATGGAPISDAVMKLAKGAFGCPIPEGYGQTEATCSITFCHPLDPTLGHCGPPVSCYMVKLIDVGDTVPDMGYFANENRGEICAFGPSRFLGYLKDPEKTAEVIDQDGWLHTGDIGMWLPNGTLKIIDRKKHLFKLSQGEYISPEKVENVYARSQFVGQVFVDGDSLQDCIVGIVVPDAPHLLNYCERMRIKGSDVEELCKNETVRQVVLEDLIRVGKQAGLTSYEQVKNVHLRAEPFNVENGLATPTMKLKRQQLRAHFQTVIANLYTELAQRKSKI